MYRFLACGHVKRFAHSLVRKQKTSCWEVYNIGPHCTGGSPFSANRFSLYYRVILKKNFLTSGKARNFYAHQENNILPFKSRPHVVFLDVGMTTELSKREQQHLLEFFKAVAVLDGHTAAEFTLKLSKRQNCPNPNSFIEDVEKSFNLWNVEDFQPADCMQQLLEHVRQHQVNLDGNICSVVVTMLVLEGWQRRLDPEYDVMRTLQTLLFISDWAKSLSYTIEGLMAP